MRPVLRTLLAGAAFTAMACGQNPAPTDDPDMGSTTGDPAEATTQTTSGASTDSGVEPPDLGPDASSFPIEVIGVCPEQGVRCALVTVRLDIDAPPDPAPGQLVVTIHNIVAEQSAEVVINGAQTISLAEADREPLRRRGGVVIAALTIDVGVLVRGENTFTFSYTPRVEGVSGYRVLDLVVRFAGQELRPDLPNEDPSTWQPYVDDPESVTRGRRFYAEISRDGGPTCGTCHVDSGADFEYFAFSNESIVRRAMFHEFSEQDAQDIANYLRSVDVARQGQIFDPPFQPGSANHGAVGAGWGDAVGDIEFGDAVFGPAGLDQELAWDFASDVDFYSLPAPVQVPTWFRWLPRDLEPQWLERETTFQGEQTSVGAAADALRADPSYGNAWRLNSAAFSVGRVLRAEQNHAASIELLRFAAVKLWEWSRGQDFDLAHHGFPDEQSGELPPYAPAYPYEVGFAFFETARDGGQGVAEAWLQAIEWWWVQLAVHDGRGVSSAQRPLNFLDVLTAAENAGLGPNTLALLHLYGSYEETRSPALVEDFGTGNGPLRHLQIPLRHLEAPGRMALWRRFLLEQVAWLAGSDQRSLDVDHLAILGDTWRQSTVVLTAADRDALRALAAPEALAALGSG